MAAGASIALVLLAAAPQEDRFARRPDQPCLDAAIQIDKWLEETAVKTPDGWAWPAVPDEFAGKEVPAEKLETSLYSGSAGIVLFGIELGLATTMFATDSPPLHDSPYLELPTQAARHLLATLPAKVEGEGCGLYTGIAGVGFSLFEMAQATVWVEGHRGARRCVELLERAARVAGSGIEWSDSTDVISGGAGIGLFLIYMAERDHDPLARDLAIRAGRRLLDLGEREPVGRSWRMDPKFPRVMPNFSHGTAGVAFFLARLYELTGDVAFLDGALDGAHYLLSIADTKNDGCQIYHDKNHERRGDAPDGRDLYYLGWCHGPIGTARLFMKLAQVTGDADWTDWTLRCANSVRTSGIPEATTPGFWNNVGQCCGTAGVASFFETLVIGRWKFADGGAVVPDDDPDRQMTRRCFDSILAHGTQDQHGLRFVQAEHRVKPELLQAQVGFMQGAAGVGFALLQSDQLPRIYLPDDPRPYDGNFVLPPSLMPAVPATLPNAATTAFENLGRGMLFVAADPRQTAKPWPFDTWFDAARAAGAKFVMLETEEAIVGDFVARARSRGFAIGLSLPLAPRPTDATKLHEWSVGTKRRLMEGLTKNGPLALLRIALPADLPDGPRIVAELYRSAKALAPHVLIEFATVDPPLGGGCGKNGIQRIGALPGGYYDADYESGQAPRVDELWPTDVVAGFEYGPIESTGFIGPFLRRLPSPAPDSAWRTVNGRRHYVPLQIELPTGRRLGASSGIPLPRDGALLHEVQLASARARNVLLVVAVDSRGEIEADALKSLRELGR